LSIFGAVRRSILGIRVDDDRRCEPDVVGAGGGRERARTT
jgi:hypothetical protein